jgi:hypothetical protein
MIPKLAKLLFLFLPLLLLFPVRGALADTGPKPSMDFEFQQEMTEEPPVTITSGILYECDQPDCSDAMPLEEGGPQGFRCEVNSCSAIAYGFARYHRIEIEFSDGKTRQSNVFETAGFDSKYRVTIRPNDLLVEARFNMGGLPRTAIILIACFCAVLGVGLIVGPLIFLLRRSQKN